MDVEATRAAEPLDLSAFRRTVSESFVPLKVSSSLGDTFRGTVAQSCVNGVSFSSVRADAHTVERTPELIRQSPRQFFKISLQLEGTSTLAQDGRQVQLRPGDMAIYDTSFPYVLAFEAPFWVMVIQLPHDKLQIPPRAVAQMTAVRIGGDEGLGRIVSPFLAQLGGNLEHLNGPAGAELATSAVGLLETLFSNELDVARAATSPHWALVNQIRDHIDTHLGDPELGPGSIAAANYISTRHLHGLFQEQGMTVGTYIRSRRLEQCHLMLTSPAHADLPVSAVGARWGFPDAAHFSRIFKAAYGESPRAMRARVLGR